MATAVDTTTEQSTGREYEPYHVGVEEYVTFNRQGFLVVKGLVPIDEVQELARHTEDLLYGRETIPGVPPPPDDLTPEQKLQYWLRVHMLHRVHPLHERFLLHPRILDVLAALIGPDVLALQSMLFFKQPGQPGQGYHQDSYYIPTFPDTLIGAWLAVDRADEENGCLWMTVGSQHEPVYPDSDGQTRNGHRGLADMTPIMGASNVDESKNSLSRVAQKFAGREVKAEVDPGDVVFFGGHVLHRSHSNRSKDRLRRSFVGHYCNARSWVPWNHGQPYDGPSGNHLHILARGDTHLPYAQPRFGTPCAANRPELRAPRNAIGAPASMMPNSSGLMTLTPHGEDEDDD